jgi:hypothetical protein
MKCELLTTASAVRVLWINRGCHRRSFRMLGFQIREDFCLDRQLHSDV